MVVVPIVGNAAQFWLTDSILQKKDWNERDKIVRRYFFLDQQDLGDLDNVKNEGKLSPTASSDELRDASDDHTEEEKGSQLDPQLLSRLDHPESLEHH